MASMKALAKLAVGVCLIALLVAFLIFLSSNNLYGRYANQLKPVDLITSEVYRDSRAGHTESQRTREKSLTTQPPSGETVGTQINEPILQQEPANEDGKVEPVSVGSEKDSEEQPTTSWSNVDEKGNTRLFSAYFDEQTPKHISVVLLGLHNHALDQQGSVKFYCVVQYPNKSKICLGKPAQQMYLNPPDEKEGKDQWAFSLTCGLDRDSQLPVFVSVSMNENCNKPQSDWIPVSRRQLSQEESVTFGVCIQTPIFGKKLHIAHLIEGIERNRAFGAEWMTVYVQQSVPDIMKVLRDYENEGFLEIVNWKLSKDDISHSHYFAESACIADCLYRNMYKAKYLAFTDLDEIIVPQKHNSWGEMMLAIDQENIGSFVFSHAASVKSKKLAAQKKAFSQNWTCHTQSTENPIKKYPLPLYILHNYRTPPYPYYKGQIPTRPKMMVKPKYVTTLGIHSSVSLKKPARVELVSKDLGLLYHFRVPPMCQKCEDVLQEDNRIHNLFPGLLGKIRDQLCHYL